MKWLSFIPCFLFIHFCSAQLQTDPWIYSQLKEVTWTATYKGVLADFHPVTITLASDKNQVAGYLIHEGDQVKHRLTGDWNKSERLELQEHDQNDRLTGYLVGTVKAGELAMQWMSADQSRLFEVKAFPESLIKIKSFKPVAEWIEVNSSPKMMISVQKMDYGIVSGIVQRAGHFTRFEGYCLDGTCSIWNTVIQVPAGAPIQVQMRQKDATTYKAMLNGVENVASILNSTPLVVKRYDNSMGFLDLVYPEFKSEAFRSWLGGWSDKLWTEGTNYLQSINKPGNSGRLIHRSSGWIEVFDDQPGFISGMITYINPGATRRTPFVLLKKEDEMILMDELLNTTADLKKLSDIAMKSAAKDADADYKTWLTQVGYQSILPSLHGIVTATEFNMIYGDDLQLIPAANCRDMIKKKYWKYFGW